MKPEILKCEKCGVDTDEYLLYMGKCYNCSEKWFCSICGEEFEKHELTDGKCDECDDTPSYLE